MQEKALEVASLAGHILLENGAEIARVEKVMDRIASTYGADSSNFFVLSNGIFTTGHGYANVEHIPFHGTQLDKVVAINQLSYEVVSGKCTLDACRERLVQIRNMAPHPAWEQVLGSALGSAGFCAIFGGSITDCIISLVCGLILWLFVIYVGSLYLSKISSNILGGALVTALCILFHHFGDCHLGNIIIGAIIPLIPGVPFTNGVRDLAGEDYIAGATRLMDALMVFLCIALGVSLSFLIDRRIVGDIIRLEGMLTDPFTAGWIFQIVSAMIGTMAFAVLFGVPRKYYVDCGISGTAGWIAYLAMVRLAGASNVEATLIATMIVGIISYMFAAHRHCPVIVFLVCGIFPLVPGAGVFWTTYNIVSDQLPEALASGFLAVKLTFAIVFGIIIYTEIRRRIPVLNR